MKRGYITKQLSIMKRIFLFIAVALTLNACAENTQIITFSALPSQAQTFVRDHFNEADVMFVTMEKDLFSTEYDLRLQDGSEISFNADGSLDKVETKSQNLPDGIVPDNIIAHVRTMFPNAGIVEYDPDNKKQTVELSNGLELEFDKDGRFVRMDD